MRGLVQLHTLVPAVVDSHQLPAVLAMAGHSPAAVVRKAHIPAGVDTALAGLVGTGHNHQSLAVGGLAPSAVDTRLFGGLVMLCHGTR